MERFHPVTLKEEIPVDVKVATIVIIDFSAKGLEYFGLVEPFGDVAKLGVAKGSLIFAFGTDVVDVLTSALVRLKESVVAVDGGWDTGPDAVGIVTVLDEG